jgi:hypothetical protein
VYFKIFGFADVLAVRSTQPMSGPCISHTHVQVALLFRNYLQTSCYVRVLLGSLHSKIGLCAHSYREILVQISVQRDYLRILKQFNNFASWVNQLWPTAFKEN